MKAALLLVCLLAASSAAAQTALTVVSAGPAGEIADIKQAAEIRVRFSEPMVPLGRIPDVVAAPFFSIRPSVAGTFRWAGPTILVFTPDPKSRLPRATRFEVRIDASATAVSGRRLGAPYSFAFTTPTARLLAANWSRRGSRAAQPLVLLLRFNQPVRAADVAAHLSIAYQRHPFTPPAATAAERLRMGADGSARFDAKVAAAAAAAAAEAAVPVHVTTDWDKKRYPPSPNLVAFETTGAPSTDGWLRLVLDNRLPAVEGPATPPAPQGRTIKLEPTFFVTGFTCRTQCNADEYNPLQLTVRAPLDAIRRAMTVDDISVAGREVHIAPKASSGSHRTEALASVSLEDAGFDPQAPARTYAVRLDDTLQASGGQTLGYPWVGIVENWHARAFTSFGDGHGVWEKGGGPLPFYARNFVDARQWAETIRPDQLMPTILALQKQLFAAAPPGPGLERRLGGAADKIESHGLDLSKALSPSGTGLVWAAVRQGTPIPNARAVVESPAGATTATIVQVTNLGITVKDSPQNTLVFVTRLDNGEPVAGANVSIVRLDNAVFWKGATDGQGIAIAPQTPLRKPQQWDELAFVVTAEKDGDIAYTASDWNEGVLPFEFGLPLDLSESQPLLRGTVFSDRGVYKPGEEVHLKGILRSDTPSGIKLIAASVPLYVTLHDSRGKLIDSRTVTINQWSTAEWTMTLASDGALGSYDVQVSLDKKALNPPAQPANGDVDDPSTRIVSGSFLVAAYRRPEFRVDATVTADPPMAGAPLKGVVAGRYLFGAPMAKRTVAWTVTRSAVFSAPAAVLNQYPDDRFAFVGCCDDRARSRGPEQVAGKTAALDDNGQLAVDVPTVASDGLPYSYVLEGDVEDVSRQHIANRNNIVVHPAPWYIGLARPPLFVQEKDGLDTAVVAVSPEGKPVSDVPVEVVLIQQQWHSVRRAEGNGFYSWETERTENEVGRYTVKSGAGPVPLSMPLKAGGSYLIRATARDAAGHLATTRLSFYALGRGYTAWARYDHNRIDLVADKTAYRPGETARIMIQSPWEQATGLLTVEREGIRSHKTFTLTSTQQTLDVPIAPADLPDVFVSVLLVKGRTKADTPDDGSDPGKPSFRLGYAQLKVEDPSKRLTVSVTADKNEFRPAGTAKVQVQVADLHGQPSASEVTLWAVDYGVLSLTGYRTPDVFDSIYVPKSLEVITDDNRQRIVSRRVLTPKGSTDGGGGGADTAVNELRKDFRVLAFWLGSVTTDSHGRASVSVKLPESLTTYRIMAVGGDRDSRFGSGESEIRINKPVVLRAAFPRFLARGDKAFFGSVVTSQLKQPGTAVVTMRSLDPNVLQIAGDGRQTVDVPAGGSTEVRFEVAARQAGKARIQTTVKIGSETDAFEDSVPVEVLSSPEAVAAYGEATPAATQKLEVPSGVVPGFGGLHLEVASTALVGLGEGARYVVEYPYGCVEQRSSRAYVLALASDLGETFKLPGIDAKDLHGRAQTALKELETFQCPSGGFAFWPGACDTVSPYMTSYVLHVYQAASALGYQVGRDVRENGYKYLEQQLATKPPANEEWWPAFTAWESFAVKVLVEAGHNQDSNINRLYGYRDRMPVFALSYLRDALLANHDGGPRADDLRRRIANAVLPEAGGVHVEELSDPYLLWFWNSNVRSTAVVLDSLVRSGESGPDIAGSVRWLMQAQKNGRWGNTQENAWALQSLVTYYRKLESQPPDFTATVRLGAEELLKQAFKGRSTQAATKDVSLAQLQTPAPARDLTVQKNGTGSLYYSARLSYERDPAGLAASDQGFHVEREYAPLVDGKAGQPATSFKAGDLIRVTIALDLPKERRYVAVVDPLPAGLEPVESWFRTTAADLARAQDEGEDGGERTWDDIWQRGTFDHVERHDDRVLLFATRLSEGHHEFSYVVRATTAGTFVIAPPRAEEMYSPEVFGRGAATSMEIKR